MLACAALLSACGGDNVQIALPRTTAMTQSGVPAAPQAGAPVATQLASAHMPQPDCAADGCKGLRIIDANAEAFRYQAMQRADGSQS